MDGANFNIQPGRALENCSIINPGKLPLDPGLSFYGIKDKDLNTIINISEQLIESHTKSVNEIVAHCSEMSSYGFHTNKILDHCNQIVSGTLNSSYMVINLCQSFTKIDLTSSQLTSLINREKSTSNSTEEKMLISKSKVENNYCSSTKDAQNSVDMTTIQRDELSDRYVHHMSVKKNPLTVSSYNRQTCNIVKEKTRLFDNLALGGSSSLTDDPASIVDIATRPHEVLDFRNSDQMSITIKNDKGKSSTDLHKVNTLQMDNFCSKNSDFPVEGECGDEFSNSLEINVLDWDKGISGSEFTCSICSKTFKTETTLKKHKQYHDRYNFVCEVCNGRFAGKVKLKKHVLSQTDAEHVKFRMTKNSFRQVESSVFVKTNSAGMVFDAFEDKESFEANKVNVEENVTKVKVEKGDRPSDDEIIDVVSEEPDFMLKRNEIEGRQVSSEVENTSFSNNDALEYDGDVNDDPDWDEVKQLDDGKVCTNTIKKEKPFKRHKPSHQIQTKDFVCKVCLEHFAKKNKLKTHISKCHSKNIKTHILTGTNKDCLKLQVVKNSVRVKRQCEICGKQYKNLCHLRHHLKTHSGVKNYLCDLCDYKGYTNQHLSRHMKSHSIDKNYQCDQCGKRFATNNNLKKHLTTHNNIRSFSCHMCSKRFNDHGALTRHSKIHKHEQQHVCEICGKRSRQAYNITVHMRTHNGHKPFSCEICGKNFAHNVSLRQHKNSCTGKIQKI
ncbi:hypothetical protein SNE40_017166 [Patella caerulea]|uniref:C2H2-type domain-containing protein n=1 Tax=Patella caerulea TaxID=87958 RepID=A0AAN8JEJ5_PATCE